MLIHGAGGIADQWQYNIDPLGENFSVCAPDLIGHGFTDSIDLTEAPQKHMVAHLGHFADALGWERFHVGGSSYGALLSALLYFDRPERIDKLILIGSGSTFHPPEQFKRALAGAIANGTAAMGDPTFETCRNRMANTYYDREKVDSALILAQLTSYALPDRFAFYQQMMAGLMKTADSEEYRVYQRLEDIAVPTLVVTGREDVRASCELTEQAMPRLPNAELHIFDQCGHQPMGEHPDRFNPLVTEFLRR